MPLPHKVQTSQPHIASKTLANLCSLISHLVFHPYSATCSFPQACGLSASVALHLLFPAHSFSYPSIIVLLIDDGFIKVGAGLPPAEQQKAGNGFAVTSRMRCSHSPQRRVQRR